MSLFQALLAESEPTTPPSFGLFQVLTGYASVAARQLALEPSVTGVDRPMSWSFMIKRATTGSNFERIWNCGLIAAADTQWNFGLRSQLETGSQNQHIQFSISTSGSAFILIQSSVRILNNRWYNIVVTYDGSETNAGLKIYLNGVEDTAAVKSTTGSYTGALNNAALRVQLSSVFTSLTQSFQGGGTTFAIWNKVLTQAKITELFGAGVPIDVTTVSFYATDIEAYWPLASSFTCANNAAFNFQGASGISFGTSPISTYYPGFTIQNARIGNTRYLAFGTSRKSGNNLDIWIRDGVDHVTNGYINKGVFNVSDLLATNPVTWTDNVLNSLPNDQRELRVLNFNGTLFGFTSVWDDVANEMLSSGRHLSTDGLVGITWASYITMETPTPPVITNFYGVPIEGDSAGQYFVSFHDYTAGAQTIYVYETTDYGVNWNKITAFSGTSQGYNEACILRTGPGNYVMLLRTTTKIFCSVSTDSCATWTTPIDSTLSTGYGMVAMCLDDRGNIIVLYADRGAGYIRISLNNTPATIFANRASWNTGFFLWQNPVGGINILGYPFIVNMGGGYFAAGWSHEVSSTRADTFVGYGAISAAGIF